VLRSKSLTGRLNRLLRAMHPSFAHPDDAWAGQRLPPLEYAVYARMDPRDREHAVRVAQKLLEQHKDAGDELVRAALLHDSGKLLRPYVWLERIAAGLSNRPTQHVPLPTDWNSRRFSAFEIRLLHPQLGAALIRAAGGSPRVTEIVERHHHPNGDAEAAIIHAIDELE
jgi:HD domain